MGLVALSSGDVATANDFLQKAGEAGGTVDSEANSYDFELAERLADVSEHKSVAEYIRLGAKSSSLRSKFNGLLRMVERGETPDFHDPFFGERPDELPAKRIRKLNRIGKS